MSNFIQYLNRSSTCCKQNIFRDCLQIQNVVPLGTKRPLLGKNWHGYYVKGTKWHAPGGSVMKIRLANNVCRSLYWCIQYIHAHTICHSDLYIQPHQTMPITWQQLTDFNRNGPKKMPISVLLTWMSAIDRPIAYNWGCPNKWEFHCLSHWV